MDLAAYFAGFVDGEGCFTVSFSPRSKLLIGWEVRPSFSVSQNADRSEVLVLLHQYFHSSKPTHCCPANSEMSNDSRLSAGWCATALIERKLAYEQSQSWPWRWMRLASAGLR
jgi:hypothetical protein